MTADKDLLPALAPLVERVRTDVSAVKTERGMAWTREALTEVRLRRHLAGEVARGVCPIKAGESTTRVALFDLDSHKGQTPWPEMTGVAEKIMARCEEIGLRPIPWRSSGGRGVHLFILWDEAQDAYSVRQALRAVLTGLGLKDGAKGVAAGQIEVFPKQDSVPEDGFGNQFILPLAGQSVPLEPLLGLEPMSREDALDVVWAKSEPVPKAERPVIEPRALPVFEGGALAEVRSALAAIDNDGEGLGYDEWRNVIVSVHAATEGSEDGYALAYEFSARSHKFDEAELRDKVWDWADSAKPGGITAATLFHLAREAGWQDVTADSFPDLAVREADGAEGAEEAELPLPAFRRDNNGRIEPTVGNLRAALSRVDVCGVDLRFDEFRGAVVFAKHREPGVWQSFADHHYFALRLTLENLGFKPFGREIIRDAVHYVAHQQPVDTAMVWLSGLEWDGVERVERFLSTYMGAEDRPYTRAVALYMWTAHAARIFEPGAQADMVPIYVGGQSAGKSSAVRALVPADHHRLLNFAQAEEARSRLLRGCLAAELPELQGLRTRELEEIKAWITRRSEEWTPKYQEFAVRMGRRALFHGTTNEERFLDDPTGERRWLPVRVGDAIDVKGIARDRDQLWAEAAAIWAERGMLWKRAYDLAKDEHGGFKVEDTWEEAILIWAALAPLEGSPPAEVGFTTREVLNECLGFSDKSVKKADEMRAAKVLKSAGFERTWAREDGKTCKLWKPATTCHN